MPGCSIKFGCPSLVCSNAGAVMYKGMNWKWFLGEDSVLLNALASASATKCACFLVYCGAGRVQNAASGGVWFSLIDDAPGNEVRILSIARGASGIQSLASVLMFEYTRLSSGRCLVAGSCSHADLHNLR